MPDYLMGHYQHSHEKRPRLACERITKVYLQAVDSLPRKMFEIHRVTADNKRKAIRIFQADPQQYCRYHPSTPISGN